MEARGSFVGKTRDETGPAKTVGRGTSGAQGRTDSRVSKGAVNARERTQHTTGNEAAQKIMSSKLLESDFQAQERGDERGERGRARGERTACWSER